MRPELFQQRLGRWSSHPKAQAARRRLFQLIAGVPIAIVIVWAALVLVDYQRLVTFFTHASRWTVAVAAGTAFFIGAFMALSLCARWAELQRSVGESGGRGADSPLIEWWVLGVSVSLGLAGPVLATWAGLIPASMRFGLHFFAILPLVGTLVGMCVLEEKSSVAATGGRIWKFLLLLLVSLVLLTLVHDLALAYQRTELSTFCERFLPYYAKLERPFLGVITLIPITFAVFAITRVWGGTMPRRSRSDEAGEPQAAPEPPQGGWWARMRNWVGWLLSPSEPDEEPEPAEDEPPAWLSALLDNLPAGCTCLDGPVLVKNGEVAQPSSAQELSLLFGGLLPTQDQLVTFERFRDSFEGVIKRAWGGESGIEEEPSADLVIQGDAGSGRTTVLIACAIFAAVCRGQRTLFLVPNDLRRSVLLERINHTLETSDLRHFIQADHLTAERLSTWLACDASVDRATVLPHIVVSTLEATETYLFGAELADAQAFSRLRRLVMLLDVIIVDDFMDFSDAQRSHLPFLLDKQRLLLEGDYLPLQVVVSCPRLADIGMEGLGVRLFTEKRIKRENEILLRPRPAGKAWRVDLEACNVPEAVAHMAIACAAQDVDVVLYRRGIDEFERSHQETELRTLSGKTNIHVISDLDQPVGDGMCSVDAIFYQVAAHEDVCMALRLHMGHDNTVIFSVRLAGEPQTPPSTGIVPILAGRASRGLVVVHLRSLIRFLRPLTPVSADAYCQIGIQFRELEKSVPVDEPDTVLEYDDHPISGVIHPAIWPYLVLKRAGSPEPAVQTHVLPDEDRGVYRHDSSFIVFIGRTASARASAVQDVTARRGQWYTSAGQKLNRAVDLAHARDLRLVHGSNTYVPLPAIRTESDGIRLETQRWHGNGCDAYLPIYTMFWSADGLEAKLLEGGPDYGFQAAELVMKEDESIPVVVQITGLMSDYGLETPINVLNVPYDARISGLLLMPRPMGPTAPDGMLARALSGAWGSSHGAFWPELTFAMNYAFENRLPGLSYFARSLAFSLQGRTGKVAKAVVFFVEPVSSGRTVMRTLPKLLMDARERRSLLESADWFLDKLQQAPSQMVFARRMVRTGFTETTLFNHIDEARELITDLLQRTKPHVASHEAPVRVEPVHINDPQQFVTDPRLEPYRRSWDPQSPVVTWQQCVQGLWSDAERQLGSSLDNCILGEWDQHIKLLVSVDAQLQPTSFPPPAGLEVASNSGDLMLIPSGRSTGRDFREAVESLLRRTLPEQVVPDTVVVLHLWILPAAEDLPGRQPRPADPFNGILVGGFRQDGLVIKAVPQPLPYGPPAPSLAPRRGSQTADTLPEEPVFPYPEDAAPGEGEWQEVLPACPTFRKRGGHEFAWSSCNGQGSQIRWGFQDDDECRRYLQLLDDFPSRSVNHSSYIYYAINDPYLCAIHDLADRLFEMYGRSRDTGLADHILAFVQSLPYLKDPDRCTDWPRFPSEHLANGGGDCEDSSILFAALLVKFGFDAAFLRMPGHLAVGVAGNFSGRYYPLDGKKYFYAETTLKGGTAPIGVYHGDSEKARIVPIPFRRLPAPPPVQILTVGMDIRNGLRLQCAVLSRLAETRLRLGLYARPTEDAMDTTTPPQCIQAIDLPPCPGSGRLLNVEFKADSSLIDSGQNVLDLAVWSEAGLVGRWPGMIGIIAG